MIKFVNVKKNFQGKIILDKVSGVFNKGVVNLIVGASGTGKSVLVKCIVGLLDLAQGQVYYDGSELTKTNLPLRTRIRKEVGMLFQGGALFDSMNVLENVMFPLDILTNVPKEEKIERAHLCLERVGLKNIDKKRISEISGGMKKRVGIARAIVNNPKYLFCDEPNSGLDPQTAMHVDELIKEITYEYKTTTVVVTHDINSMLTIGDNIMFLYKGKITWEGNSESIFESKSKSFNSFFFSNKMANMIQEKKL